MTRTPARDYSGLSTEEMVIGLQVARVGLGRSDFTRDTIHLDDIAAEIFDMPAGVPIPRADLHARIHPDDWPDVQLHLGQLGDAGGPDVLDMTHRTVHDDGSIRWVNARKRVIYPEGGSRANPERAVFAVVDVTQAKLSEQRNEILIGELNHRTKNLITVVASIARQLKRHSTPEEFPDRFVARLQALARNQEIAAHGPARGFHLGEILNQQVAPFLDAAQGRITAEGPTVVLSSQMAQVAAMMFHELLTNASKHGALRDDGQVAVRWRIEDGKFVLEWTEIGGPAVREPQRMGYGSQVLKVLTAATFGGEVDLHYASEGFRMVLRAPANGFGPE